MHGSGHAIKTLVQALRVRVRIPLKLALSGNVSVSLPSHMRMIMRMRICYSTKSIINKCTNFLTSNIHNWQKKIDVISPPPCGSLCYKTGGGGERRIRKSRRSGVVSVDKHQQHHHSGPSIPCAPTCFEHSLRLASAAVSALAALSRSNISGEHSEWGNVRKGSPTGSTMVLIAQSRRFVLSLWDGPTLSGSRRQQ